MIDVRRVALPGVGVLHSFTTDDGVEVSVVAHRTGASDLMMRPSGSGEDHQPTIVRLSDDEARVVAELLGGTSIVTSISELDELPGVPMDWFVVDADDAVCGRTIGEFGRPGEVVIAAVVREDHAYPTPADDFVTRLGDTIVAIGPKERVDAAFGSFRHGTAPTEHGEEPVA